MIQPRWAWLPQAFLWSDVVAFVINADHRDYQPSGTHALADHSSLREHVCRRYGHVGIFFSDSYWRADRIFGLAHRSFVPADLHFRAVDDGVFGGSSGGGALGLGVLRS